MDPFPSQAAIIQRTRMLVDDAMRLQTMLSATMAQSVAIRRANPRSIRGELTSRPARNVGELRREVATWLVEGSLPSPAKGWAGLGIGNLCSVCRIPIVMTEIEYEARIDGMMLFAHIPCYEIWKEEAARLDGASADGHPPGEP